MRFLPLALVLLFALSLTPAASAGDSKKPKVFITKVVKKKLGGGLTSLVFTINATDNVAIRRIEYRVAVDGKDSGWTNYPYFEGSVNELPFGVDCDVFRFQVRSVDKARNKSQVASKSFSGLR